MHNGLSGMMRTPKAYVWAGIMSIGPAMVFPVFEPTNNCKLQDLLLDVEVVGLQWHNAETPLKHGIAAA